MESNTLDGIVNCTPAGAISVIAPSVALPMVLVRPALVARNRTAPLIDTRSQAGVGSYRVEGMWRLDDQLDPQDPKFSTHKFFTQKFSTRQGPPTCSPPV